MQFADYYRPKGVFEYKQGEIAPAVEGETSADYNAGLPVVAFTLSDQFKKDYPHVKQVAVSNLLRAKQYIVPSKCRTKVSPQQAVVLTNRPNRLPAPPRRGEDRDPTCGCERVDVVGSP